MKKIYKYVLDINIQQQIELPLGAEVLSVQMQNEQICLWAKVDTSQQMIKMDIYTYGTGQYIEEDDLTYIGTVQDGSFVWHIFIK